MFTTLLVSESMHSPVGTHADRRGLVKTRANRTETKRNVQARQRAWLREVLEKTRLKPSQLALGANVSDTTLTRMLNNESYTGTLSPETILRIKSTYNVPGPDEYSARRSPLIGLSEAARLDFRKEKGPLAAVIQAIVADRENIEPWRLKTMALESVGYLPGDIVFVRMLAEDEQPRPQDAVCAQVVDYQHGSAETVWRVYDPPFLVGAANDRTAYKPLLVDGDRVKIAGIIRESYRPHSLSAMR